jgi:hypothetical protein
MLRTGEMSDDLWKPMEPLLPEGSASGAAGNSHRPPLHGTAANCLVRNNDWVNAHQTQT